MSNATVDLEGYCTVCEQDGSNPDIHIKYCPGKIETRPFKSGQLSFKTWKKLVNSYVMQMSGVTLDDIEDWHYWDAWNCMVQPRTAAISVLENAGFPFED